MVNNIIIYYDDLVITTTGSRDSLTIRYTINTTASAFMSMLRRVDDILYQISL